MMVYKYLIGYRSTSKHGTQQIGRTIITRNKPILNLKDVEEIELWLQKDCGIEKIIVLSFSKLEGFD